MKRRILSIAFLVFALVLTLVLAFTLVVKPGQQAKSQNNLTLAAPPFVGEAQAQDNSPEAFNIGAYLDQEAGISAYFKGSAINLNSVRSLFRTIEIDDPNYIIGSIQATGYVEHFDVHAYVHKDGWIMAYYLKQDPAAKIVDLHANSITTTKLKNVVSAVAAAAGSIFSDVTYYDFRYPAATNMLLVYEDNANGNDFNILLPSAYGILERSFTVSYQFYLNNVGMPEIFSGDYADYGIITPGQMAQDVTHKIEVTNAGVLVIIYRVP